MSSKTLIEQELETLREQAVARNVRDKYSGSGSFLTPEEAMAFLAKQRKLQDQQPITPPSYLTSTSELSDWYMQQRQREVDERKRREEAEAFLRSYKAQSNNSVSRSSSSEVLSTDPSQDDSKNLISPLSSNEDKEVITDKDANVILLTPSNHSSQDSKSEIVSTTESQVSLSNDRRNIIESSTEESYFDGSHESVLNFSHQAEIPKESKIENIEVALSETNIPEDKIYFSPTENDDDSKHPNSKTRSSVVPNYRSISPTLPFSLTDLTDWYMIQRQRDLEERKKREEAEAYLHSYRPQWLQTNGKDRKPCQNLLNAPIEPGININSSSNICDSVGEKTSSHIENGEGDGSRLSPVLRMVSQFLQDHFKDDEGKGILFPSLSETNPLCHSDIVKKQHSEEVLTHMYNRFELYLTHGCHLCHQIAVALCLKGLNGHISINYRSKLSSETVLKQLSEDEMVVAFDEILCSTPGSAVNIIPLPSFWDRNERTLISLDPMIILRKINSDFDDFARFPHMDLYPLKHHETIDEIIANVIYKGIYDGAIACGAAKNQVEYDAALDKWTESFDHVHNLLQKKRYVGDSKTITLADIALFTILVRVESVFSTLFLVNNRSILTHPILLNYLREIFQMPNVEETVDIDAMKEYYYRMYPLISNHGIIPRGNNYFLSRLKQPHNRMGSLEYLMQAFEM